MSDTREPPPAGDLDGDAKIDLVGNAEDSDLGWVLRGKANGAFSAPKKIPSSTGRLAERMAIGNIIGRAANDLVSASSSSAYLYEGLGGGRLKAPLAVGPGFGYTGNVALADVNKDGKLDLITSHFHNFEAYDGPSDYALSSLLVFLNGAKPSIVTISNLSLTTLTYRPASSGQGTVTAVGSVSFQDSGGDVRYTGAADPSQSAFLEFHVTAVFPNNSWVASGNYRVSGPYMNLPGQKSGTIAFNLSLPIRSQGVGTPTLSITGFRLYDSNLVRSNDLARR